MQVCGGFYKEEVGTMFGSLTSHEDGVRVSTYDLFYNMKEGTYDLGFLPYRLIRAWRIVLGFDDATTI